MHEAGIFLAQIGKFTHFGPQNPESHKQPGGPRVPVWGSLAPVVGQRDVTLICFWSGLISSVQIVFENCPEGSLASKVRVTPSDMIFLKRRHPQN